MRVQNEHEHVDVRQGQKRDNARYGELQERVETTCEEFEKGDEIK